MKDMKDMKDIEIFLRGIDFSNLSKIKNKLLNELLAERKLNDDDSILDLEELDQVTAAKGNEWIRKNNSRR